MNNYIVTKFEKGNLVAKSTKLTQYDYGQSLKIIGLDLPANFEAQFSKGEETITMLGNDNIVAIPDECLLSYGDLRCYIFLHKGASDGKTCYTITIPVMPRVKPGDSEPTPVQQDVITQTIAALNQGVERAETAAINAEGAAAHYPIIQNEYWYVWNVTDGEYINTNVKALGEDGVGIKSTVLNDDYTLTITFTDDSTYTTGSIRGEKGEKGDPGAIKFLVREVLPVSDIDTTAIYLIPSSDPLSQNTYDEYVYINDNWELLGQAHVDVPTKTSDLINDSNFAYEDDIILKEGIASNSSHTAGSISGAKGWKWSSAQLIEDDTLLKIYPIGDFSAIKINDRISVKASYSWSFFGYVTSIAQEYIIVQRYNSSKPIPSNFIPEDLVDSDSGYFWLIDNPAAGVFVIGEGALAIGNNNKANELGSFASGRNNIADGRYSLVAGTDNEGGYGSLIQGHSNNVTGLMGTALGYGNNVQGDRSLAVGESNIVKGINSFALGHTCLAQGDASFASGSSIIVKSFAGHGEGHLTEVEGEAGHAEGRQTKAKGAYSHAEGAGTQAEGIYAHAENAYTLASSNCQHVQGKYNVEDKEGKYADIVGWGSNQQRKNISALTTSGDLKLKGSLFLGVNDDSTGGIQITGADKTKLNGIASGAQVNTIESISVNNTPIVPDNKNINITVPTKVSDLTNDSGFVTSSYHDSMKQDVTDNSLDTNSKVISSAINEVNSIAKGANQALSFVNYSTLVTAFNTELATTYNIGQNVMVVTLDVPDLWISGIESTSSSYTYTTDAAIIDAIKTNGYIQIGYYKLSALETQKVDLTNYVSKTITIAGVDLQDNITKSELLTALNVEDGAEANTVESVSAYGTALPPDANGNVNIPRATENSVGLVSFGGGAGIAMDNTTSRLTIDKAGDEDITPRTNQYKPIVPYHLNFAVKSALSDTNHLTMNSTEQGTAKDILGVNNIIFNANNPTTSSVGKIGDMWINTGYSSYKGSVYYCSAVTPQGTTPETYTYTWTYINQLLTTSPYRGIALQSGGMAVLAKPTDTQINNRNDNSDFSNTTAVVLDKFDYAVKKSLTTSNQTLTDAEKTSACGWLGTGKMVTLTQAAYDALVSAGTVDADTYYYIVEE